MIAQPRTAGLRGPSPADAARRTSVPVSAACHVSHAHQQRLRLAPVRTQPQRKRAITQASMAGAGGPLASLSPELKASIDEFIKENKIVVFMKGTKEFPQCGFSKNVVQILNTYKVDFETVNILVSEELRNGMKMYSQWPTFPQVYINGDFFGGCDIMIDAYQSGELAQILDKVKNS